MVCYGPAVQQYQRRFLTTSIIFRIFLFVSSHLLNKKQRKSTGTNLSLVFSRLEQSSCSVLLCLNNREIVDVFLDIVRVLFTFLKFKIKKKTEESNVRRRRITSSHLGGSGSGFHKQFLRQQHLPFLFQQLHRVQEFLINIVLKFKSCLGHDFRKFARQSCVQKKILISNPSPVARGEKRMQYWSSP